VKWWGKVATFGLLFVLPLFLLSVMVTEHVSASVGQTLMAIAWPIAVVAVALYWVVGFSYLFGAIRLAKEVTRESGESSDRVNSFNEGV
jgi:hypothetical protein